MDDHPLFAVIVEDNQDDALLLGASLRLPGGTPVEYHHCDTLSSALRYLSSPERPVSIIVLDLNLPDSMGISTFRSIHDRYPDIPVIVYSGSGEEDAAAQTMRAGAQDYLIKGQINAPALRRMVVNAVERHSLQMRLTVAHEYAEMILQGTDGFVIGVDLSGKVTLWNRATERATGYGQLDILKKKFVDILASPLQRSQFQNLISRLEEQDGAGEQSCDIIWRDGTVHPVTIRMEAVRSQGKISGAILYGHDLTERVRRQTQERAHSIVGSVVAALNRVDTVEGVFRLVALTIVQMIPGSRVIISQIDQHKRELVTKAVEGFLDAWQDDPVLREIGRSLYDVVIPLQYASQEVLAGYRSGKLVCLAGGIIDLCSGVRPAIAPDTLARLGTQIGPHVAYCAGFTYLNRHFAGIDIVAPDRERIESLRDILEDIFRQTSIVVSRMYAEHELRKSLDRFRTLIEHAPFAVVLIRDVSVVYGNERFMRLFGFSDPDTLAGHHLLDRIAPAHRPLAAGNIEQLASEKRAPVEFETVCLRMDGTEFPCFIAASQVELEDGSANMAIVVDLTAQKQLETQLHQSQKMEAIGKLAGGVAHDFNNLLSVIIGYCDIILAARAKPVEQSHEDVMEIRKAGQSAAALTAQLLAFSRKQSMQPVKTSLNSMIENMRKMLLRLVGEDVQITIDLDPAARPVFVDLGQQQQVIMNLVVNARDAMPNGGALFIHTRNVTVTDDMLSAYPDARRGEYVALSVRDNGTGMTEEVRQRIFEPFFSTKGPGKGTGLGLSVVYGIVIQSGGFIQVISQVGKGTEFLIHLPVYVGEDDVCAAPMAGPVKNRGRGEHLLIVEDAPEIRKFLERTFVEHGYIVTAVGSAEEGATRFRESHGDVALLFTDSVLPGKSGVLLANELRTLAPELPIIVGSGYLDDRSQWETIRERGYTFLKKPYEQEVLLNTVNMLLDRRKAQEEDHV